jgi:hypothetical protein
MSLEVASLGVQVHGGMGFIEETGAAQYLRDAKILTIYEGTTAIQANDLVGRKTARDGGELARGLAQRVAATEAELLARPGLQGHAIAHRLAAARAAFLDVVNFVVERNRSDPNAVFAGSVPYLMMAGTLVAGWQMARAFMVAEELHAAGEDPDFMQAKIITCRFYADHLLPRTLAWRDSIVDGAAAVTDMPLDAF